MFNNYRETVLTFLFLINIMPIQTQGTERVENYQSLRILDINVWSGLNYKGILKMGEYETDSIRETRYQTLILQIKQLNPDIIGIHEANKLPQYTKRLASDIGYEVFDHVSLGGIRMGPVGIPWNLREGDAILVKRHLNPQWIDRKQLSGGYVSNTLAFHLSDATQIIAVKIECNNKPFYIFATHWHASVSDSSFFINKLKELYRNNEVSQDEYLRTLSKIKGGLGKRFSESCKTIEFIEQTAGDQSFVLMGDMNAESDSREIKNLIENNMVDLFDYLHPDSPGYTWNPKTNNNYKTYYQKDKSLYSHLSVYEKLEQLSRDTSKRIDYIFLGPSSFLKLNKISVQSCKVVMDKLIHGVHASDHFGVLAVIKIKD